MKIRVLILSLVVLMPLSHCFAEWFDGEIQKVDLKEQEIAVSEVDPITETERTEVVVIVPQTVFSGVAALKEVRIGDEVSIEARYDEASDAWQAVSVEVIGAGE